MPKLKTHSGTKDRFKLTKTGKVQSRHSFAGHNLEKKTAARKRRIATTQNITGRIKKQVKRKLGV